jgi:hypothetical protein
VTSDSLAVRVATLSDAEQLVLLKSVTWQEDRPWTAATQSSVVDVFFPEAIRRASPLLQVRVVNLRAWSR